jgi:hypothetical protein
LFKAGDAVCGFMDFLDANIDEQVAHHLAHEGIVVDHQNAEALNQEFDMSEIHHDATATSTPTVRAMSPLLREFPVKPAKALRRWRFSG